MADEAIRFQFEGDVDPIVRELQQVTREGRKQGQALARELGKANDTIAKDAQRTGSSLRTSWTSALKGAAGPVAVAAAAFAGLGATVVGVAATFRSWSDDVHGVIDTIGTMEAATGLSAETIDGLRLLAGQTNKSLEELVPKDLAKRILETSQGTGEALRSFNKFDIATTNLDGSLRSADEVFVEVIDKLSAVENPTERAAEAVKLLGEEGKNLFSALENTDDLQRFVDLAGEFGIQTGPEAVRRSQEWFAATSSLTTAFEDLQSTVVNEFGDEAVGVIEEVAVGTVFLSSVVREVSVDVGRLAQVMLIVAKATAPMTAGFVDTATKGVALLTSAALDNSDALQRAQARAEEFRAAFFSFEFVGPTLDMVRDRTAAAGQAAATAGAVAVASARATAGAHDEATESVAEMTAEYGTLGRVLSDDVGTAAMDAVRAIGSLNLALGDTKRTLQEVLEEADATFRQFEGVLTGIAADLVTITENRAQQQLDIDKDRIAQSLALELDALNAQLQLELEAVGDTEDSAAQRAEIEARFAAIRAQTQADFAAQREQVEFEAAKRAFEANQKFQIAQATIEAARAFVALLPAFAFLGPFAPVAAGLVAGGALTVAINSGAPVEPGGPTDVSGATGGGTQTFPVGRVPGQPDHVFVGVQPEEGIASRRAMADPVFRDRLRRANHGQRSSPGDGELLVRVEIDERLERLRITTDRRLGKRPSRRR